MDTSQKQILQFKRTKKACQSCRVAKAGCDQQRPCARCITLNIVCEDTPVTKKVPEATTLQFVPYTPPKNKSQSTKTPAPQYQSTKTPIPQNQQIPQNQITHQNIPPQRQFSALHQGLIQEHQAYMHRHHVQLMQEHNELTQQAPQTLPDPANQSHNLTNLQLPGHTGQAPIQEHMDTHHNELSQSYQPNPDQHGQSTLPTHPSQAPPSSQYYHLPNQSSSNPSTQNQPLNGEPLTDLESANKKIEALAAQIARMNIDLQQLRNTVNVHTPSNLPAYPASPLPSYLDKNHPLHIQVVPISIWMGKCHDLVDCNEPFARLLGYDSVVEFISSYNRTINAFDIIAPSLRESIAQYCAAAATKHVLYVERPTRILLKGGNVMGAYMKVSCHGPHVVISFSVPDTANFHNLDLYGIEENGGGNGREEQEEEDEREQEEEEEEEREGREERRKGGGRRKGERRRKAEEV